MGRYRDVKSATIFTTPWTGVQEISTNFEAENWSYSADDNEEIRRTDVSKQKITFTINVLDPSYNRDIKDPIYGTSPSVALNEVLRATMTQSCDVLTDSAEEDQWITYIGVTKKKIEAEIELRDISQIITEATLAIGDCETLQFDVLPGAAATGLADGTAYERFYAYYCTLVGISPSLKHGEIGSGTLNFIGHGDASNTARIYNTLSGGGSSGFEKHVGDTGTVLFTAPSTAGSGSDVAVSIVNCVCTQVEIVAVHGGTLERRYTFEAYSSDGSTSPVSLP